MMTKIYITTLAASLLLFTGSIAGAQSARARIADTPIRGEANLASAIIATLKEGGPVEVVDLQGDWYRVLVPNEQGKPRVGYVLARLIEIVSAGGSPQSIPAPPTNQSARPVAQVPPIPPTLAQLERDKPTEREQALKAKVDALQIQVQALQDSPPESDVPRPNVPGTALAVAPASTAAAVALRDVRKVYIDKMPNDLDQYISAEVTKQMNGQIVVVVKKEDADAILRGTADVKSGVGAAITGRYLGLHDNATGSISMVDSKETVVLWSGEAGDRNMWAGFMARGGARKVADRLVHDLKKAIEKSRQTQR
jgi:hypothetical protein